LVPSRVAECTACPAPSAMDTVSRHLLPATHAPLKAPSSLRGRSRASSDLVDHVMDQVFGAPEP